MNIILKTAENEKYARTKFKLLPGVGVDASLVPADDGSKNTLINALEDYIPENENFLEEAKHSLTSIVVNGETRDVNLGIYNEYEIDKKDGIYANIINARGEERSLGSASDRFPKDPDTQSDNFVGGNEYGIPSNGSVASLSQFLNSLQKRIFDRQYALTKYSHRFYDDNYCKSYTINFMPKDSKVAEKTFNDKIAANSFLIPTAVIQVANPPSDLECRLYIRDIPILYRKTITSNNWVLFTFPEYLFDYYENFEAIQRMEFSTTSTDLSETKFYLIVSTDVTNPDKITKEFYARNKTFLGMSQANSNIITYYKRNLDDSPDYDKNAGALSIQTLSVETPVVATASKRGRKKKSASSENTSSS